METENLMKKIDEQYTKTPFYGSRRITEIFKAEGLCVNRKRIQRLMRLMEIQAIYRKPNTSKSRKEHKIYPYLLGAVTVDRADQAWASDITYIPMKKGFLYLTVVMDWHTRYILSWRLSNSMDSSLCTEALDDALALSTPEIFNTDQGSQYTSEEFTKRLLARGVQISMDGKGCYLDNIFVERLWRSIKYEEVYLHAYESPQEARRQIAQYINFYNFERLHQSLGYRTPAEVYAESKANQSKKSIDVSVPYVVSLIESNPIAKNNLVI